MSEISESLEFPAPKMNSIILLNEEKRKELGFSSPDQHIRITEETLVKDISPGRVSKIESVSPGNRSIHTLINSDVYGKQNSNIKASDIKKALNEQIYHDSDMEFNFKKKRTT
jgi:hypothetical protein